MKKILIFISCLLMLNLFMYNTKETKALEIDKIVVDIKGAVESPGLYEVEVGSTVYDLIGLAGGLRSYADTSLINLSKRLSDEDVVIVYTIDEVASMTEGDTAIKVIEKECMCPKIENVACVNPKETSSSNNSSSTSVININTASLEELQKLSGIGKSKAEAIIEYRTNTPFTKPEDITNVKGIGKSTYEKNKDIIGV